MEKLRIGIVGIGLIGGSLLKSLNKNTVYELFAVSYSQSTIDKIKKQNLAQHTSLDFALLKDCDVVFITVPMNKILETIDKVADVVSEKCIITDAGSLKEFVLDYVNKKQLKFVGGHPMAGTENKGIDSAVDELFLDTKWVLVSSNYSDEKDVKKLAGIINSIGAQVVLSEAKQHDNAVALISHMPMVLSQALFSAVANIEDTALKELALKLASSGFRDMTRLAMSNSEMAKDMIENNFENIAESMNMVSEEAKKLMDTEYFDSKIGNIIEKRKNIYSVEGKNIF